MSNAGFDRGSGGPTPFNFGDGAYPDAPGPFTAPRYRRSQAPETERWVLPTSFAGRYRVDAELGAGVQGRVVRAWDGLLRREVAIKVFRDRTDDAGRVDRRSDEARLLASLNHRALTMLYDAGTDRSTPTDPLTYLVMEYVAGSDLRAYLRTATLDAGQVCWLGYDLCDALDCLHRAGFLHRDIKPANVLLTEQRPAARIRAKLTDFGISTLVSTPHTPGRVTGTAAYIAPEQAEDLPPTRASDIYALGLVLIEAVTGRRAFPGPEQESAFARLERQPELPDDLPAPLIALLTAMTARHPIERPTAADAAAQFRTLGLQETRLPTAPARTDTAAESARLAAVHRYHILDTPPEDAFDDLTALAARVLRVPSAIISITDRDRVWFKSRQDFSEPQIDRNIAICTLEDRADRAWSILDAANDPRTRNNPLVMGAPHIRGYAAAPLRTHDGHVIGTFCVLDQRPHAFSVDDLTVLSSLAAVVMRELELRLASRRVIFNRTITDPAEPALRAHAGPGRPRTHDADLRDVSPAGH